MRLGSDLQEDIFAGIYVCSNYLVATRYVLLRREVMLTLDLKVMELRE